MGGIMTKRFKTDKSVGVLEMRFLHTLKWGDVKMANAYPAHFKGRFAQDDWYRVSHQLETRVNAYDCDEKRMYQRFLKYLVISCIVMAVAVAPAVAMTVVGATSGNDALFAVGVVFGVCFFVGTVAMVSISQCLMPAAVQGWVRGVYAEVESMLPELEGKFPTVALTAPVKKTDIGTPDLSVCTVCVHLLDGSPKVHGSIRGTSLSNFYPSSTSISSRGAGSSVELLKTSTGTGSTASTSSRGGGQSARNLFDHNGQHYGGGSMHAIGARPRPMTAPRSGGSLRDIRISNGVQQQHRRPLRYQQLNITVDKRGGGGAPPRQAITDYDVNGYGVRRSQPSRTMPSLMARGGNHRPAYAQDSPRSMKRSTSPLSWNPSHSSKQVVTRQSAPGHAAPRHYKSLTNVHAPGGGGVAVAHHSRQNTPIERPVTAPLEQTPRHNNSNSSDFPFRAAPAYAPNTLSRNIPPPPAAGAPGAGSTTKPTFAMSGVTTAAPPSVSPPRSISRSFRRPVMPSIDAPRVPLPDPPAAPC